jgi:hypothetical protein
MKIQIAEYIRLKEQGRIELVEVQEDMEGPVMVVRTKGTMKEQPAAEPSRLTQQLEILLAKAERYPGQTQRAERRGLRIQVQRAGDQVKLLLARRGATWPSDKELETVLAHWPGGPQPMQEPRRFIHNGYACLSLAWPADGGAHAEP